MSIVNGKVAFTNGSGQTTVSEYTISNFASFGIPPKTNGVAGQPISMTLSTYQTAGLAAKLNGALIIDATDATSAQINAFIASHTNAAGGSLVGASVTASQLVSLGGLLGNAVAVDASGATAAQIDYMIGAAADGVIADAAITNASLTAAQFGGFVDDEVVGKFAAKAVTIDASGILAGDDVQGLIDDTVAFAAQVLNVNHVAIDASNVGSEAFGAFVALAPLGITSVDATAFDATDWTLLIAGRSAIAQGAISGTNPDLSVTNFLTIPNKFAEAGVTGINFTNANSDQIADVIASKLKLAQGSVFNAVLTPAEFSALTIKIADGNATVDAAEATSAEVTSILQNLQAFSSSLDNLSLTADQFDGVDVTQLNDAVSNGTLHITATSAATIDTSAMTKAVQVIGSTEADVITVSAFTESNLRIEELQGSTVQGGKGSDSITGSDGADSLNGGNAADTIDGGAGNDTITGGKSIAEQYFTGGEGDDTFVMNGGNNVITDLGGAAPGNESDVLINAAVVSDTVTTVANNIVKWVATDASSNNGALTLNAKSGDSTIDAALLAGLVGVTINGGSGNDSLTGTVNSDSITGGAGNDHIFGDKGTNTLTGGTGTDMFHVDGKDTITDLSGTDDVIVAVKASVNATVTGDWVAGEETVNNGTAVVTVGNGFDVDVHSANPTVEGAGGWDISAEGNTLASVIVGSNFADTLTGGSSADTIDGGEGDDIITGGVGADNLTGGAGDDTFVYAATGDTVIATAIQSSGNVVFAQGAEIINDFGDENINPLAGIDTIQIGDASYTKADWDSFGTLSISANGQFNATAGDAPVYWMQGTYEGGVFTAGTADADVDFLFVTGTEVSGKITLAGVSNMLVMDNTFLPT